MTISRFDTPEITSEIEITAVYFKPTSDDSNHSRGTKQRLESYPKRMLLDGREYTFVEAGMRYLVHKGQELIRLFDVSDGQNNYRLRLDAQDHWTLVAMNNFAQTA